LFKLEKENIKIGSNKSFGIVFFVFFLLVGIFPLLSNENIRTWSIILSIVFLILGLLSSSILSPLNKIWFKFGILLGNIVSPVVLGIVFFIIVTPTSLIMKILGKDILGLKKSIKKTYWIEKIETKSKMKNQF
tara:strand:- start:719 stop:1117 length:399 start_codon:yes stop_codon:yes gene_type:complete